MLSTRLWVRDFPISSALCLVSPLRGSTPPLLQLESRGGGGGGSPSSHKAMAAGLGLCSHHRLTPVPMCVCQSAAW